jgi:hypothetical protein
LAETVVRDQRQRTGVELLFVAFPVVSPAGPSEDATMRNAFLILSVLPLLTGCVVETVAKTAVDVVTIPVKVASAGVDAVTTSKAEADQKRGRELRKQDEERGKQVRMAQERCRKGRPLPTDDCTAVAQR